MGDIDEETVLLFAVSIGIDVSQEKELLRIAKRALTNLPDDWELGIGEGEYAGYPFFHNIETDESIWSHPEEDLVKQALSDKRKRLAEKRGGSQASKSTPSRVASKDKEKSVVNKSELTRQENSDMLMDTDFDAKYRHADDKVFKTSTPVRTPARGGHSDDVRRWESQDGGGGGGGHDDDGTLRGGAKKRSSTDLPSGYNNDTTSTTVSSASAVVEMKKVFRPKQVPVSVQEEAPVEEEVNEFDIFRQGAPPSTQKGKKTTAGTAATTAAAATTSATSVSAPRVIQPVLKGRAHHGESLEMEDVDSGFIEEVDPPPPRRFNTASSVNAAATTAAAVSVSGATKQQEKLKSASKDNRQAQREQEREYEPEQRVSRAGSPSRTTREKDSRPDRQLQDERPQRSQQQQQEDVYRRSDNPSTTAAAAASSNSHSVSTYELESLKQKLLNTERELLDERSARKRSEDNAAASISLLERKLRDAMDASEEKLRETTKRVRADVEDDARERVRVAERKLSEELNEVKDNLQAEKRKTEDLRVEVESSRKRLLQSRDSLKNESADEVDRLRKQATEAEDAFLAQSAELKKLREEYTSLATKLASSLQLSSIAQAEMEGLRITSATASAEAHTCHAALVQATQRMQQLDSEIVGLRTENYMLRQENEVTLNELRKLRLSTGSNDDRAQLKESEIKRKNTQLQNEVHRLSARTAELEAINTIQRNQLDTAEQNKLESVREVQRNLDRVEYEAQRLKNRLVESDSRHESDANKLLRLEGNIADLSTQLASKELNLKEERRKYELVKGSMLEHQEKYDAEIIYCKQQLEEERKKNIDLTREYKLKIRDIQDEANENVAKIMATINISLQEEYEQKMEYATKKLKVQYEEKYERLRRDMIELEVQQAEKEASRRITMADDKAELEALRIHIKQLQLQHQQQQQQQQYEFDMSYTKGNHQNNNNMFAMTTTVPSSSGITTAGGTIGNNSINIMQNENVHPNNNMSQYSIPSPQIVTMTPSISQQHNQHNQHNQQQQYIHPNALENQVMEALQGQLKAMRSQLNISTKRSAYSNNIDRSDRTSSSPYTTSNSRPSASNTTSHVSHSRHDFERPSSPIDDVVGIDIVEETPRIISQAQKITKKREDEAMDKLFQSPAKLSMKSSTYLEQQQEISFDMSMLASTGEGVLLSSTMNRSSSVHHQPKEKRVKFAAIMGGEESDYNLDFSTISDGGFHEGYWRLKYSQ